MSMVGALLTLFSLIPFSLSAAAQNDQSLPKSDFSKEAVVIERSLTKMEFQSDGTYTSDQQVRARIQSDAGVRAYGVLPFPYPSSTGTVEIKRVQVIKTDGSTVVTPLDSVQDVTSELSRSAPIYSDIREKNIAVKGLEPGDTLEYETHWAVDKPLVPGQFWTNCQFIKNLVVLDEELTISVPAEREIKVKSRTAQPTISKENGRRVYSWKRSNLESHSPEKEKDAQTYYSMHGLLPPPDVMISSFRTWDEVGQWYGSLQKEKVEVTPEIKSKAEELTKGLTSDDAKLRAIYDYVSLRYRYIEIAFGVGRYQPHSAAEVLSNGYGDCKDKETLLASLLSAVGIHIFPALINTGIAIDPDVPSPGQFDHVIGVLRRGTSAVWLDTTPELTPLGDLVPQLRGKPALVIASNRAILESTPANPPFQNKDRTTVTAKLDSDGTLHAHSETIFEGDGERYFRYVFRRIPESQWKDYGQKAFYGGRRGGTVANVNVSSPEKTDEPFKLNYDYTLTDFFGGEKHRFVIPLSSVTLPDAKEIDLSRTTPLWIGQIGDEEFDSRIELPRGWSVIVPKSLDLSETFAEFHDRSELTGNVLVTKRHLVVKSDSVEPAQLTDYKSFRKAVNDVWNSYIFMTSSSGVESAGPAITPAQAVIRSMDEIRQAMLQLPGSSNSEALQAEQKSRQSLRDKDYASAVTMLKHAVDVDPSFSRAWIELGTIYYAGTRESKLALDAFQKSIDADPKQVVPYKLLAFLYYGIGDQDKAISTWQGLQKIALEDPDLLDNLAQIYVNQKRYSDALPLLQSAVKVNPTNAYAQLRLGIAQLQSQRTNEGIETLHKAVELNSKSDMLNTVAYELVELNTDIPNALMYSQRSVKEAEEESAKIDITKIQIADLESPLKLSAYWDTLGWIYFKMNDLDRSETYLNAAWQLSQDGLIGDHLGQLYERCHKLSDALHTYNLALGVNPRLPDTAQRIHRLADVHLPPNRLSALNELSEMRTLQVQSSTKESTSADFDVLFTPEGKIEATNFLRGSDALRSAGGALQKVRFSEPTPDGSVAHILRRGVLSCAATGCSFVFYPPSVAVESKH